MPTTTSGATTTNSDSENSSDEDDNMATEPNNSSTPHLIRIFLDALPMAQKDILCFPLCTDGTQKKQKLILPMYLQEMALDQFSQLQSQNQYATNVLTYEQIKNKLVNLCHPRIPVY